MFLESALTIRQAMDREYEYVKLNESEGRISSDFIIPYPPGYPFVVPGEVISAHAAERLAEMSEKGYVIGIDSGKIRTVRE